MKIYLIRHGQTEWNTLGKIQGRHDIPLNETGRDQAARLARGMDSRPVELIFSSPQKRALETAKAIADRQQAKVAVADGLREVEFGDWEGLTWADIKERYPKEYERWCINPVEVAPPGGENQMEALRRSAAAVEGILSASEGKNGIAIVTHGATMAYIVAYLMRDHPGEEIIVDNASITTVEYSPLTGDYQVVAANDTSHLGQD